MHLRLVTLTLTICLIFSTAACSKKADQTNNQAATNNENAPASTTPATNAATAPAPAPEPAKPKIVTVTIPAGTALTVRLGQAVGSKISQAGQNFTATLANPVTAQGKTIIPAGASASGTVVDAKPLGRFKGGALLQVQLTSINVNGTDRQIQTTAFSESEKGKGKRTAIGAGGGAALGGIVGGLLGGGKGAAVGLLAGGGAGTAGAAFTGNKEIVLPAESAISFKLSQPLEVKEQE
jgi:hypothetical protein